MNTLDKITVSTFIIVCLCMFIYAIWRYFNHKIGPSRMNDLILLIKKYPEVANLANIMLQSRPFITHAMMDELCTIAQEIKLANEEALEKTKLANALSKIESNKIRRGTETITTIAIGPNRSSEIDPIITYVKAY